MTQRKSRLYTHRMVLLKRPLIPVHLRGVAMLYSSFVSTHSICKKFIYNMSINISSYIMLIISITIPYSCQLRIFGECHKSPPNFFLSLR